jgi:hypothetical protein
MKQGDLKDSSIKRTPSYKFYSIIFLCFPSQI